MTNPTLDRLQTALPERYRIVRVLRRGGMGVLYLATERHPNRQVVLKVLDPEVANRLGRERFVREIDLVSSLIHPHVVPIYAAGESGGILYYVMPYVEGRDLSEHLASRKTLTVGSVLRIGIEVADALGYAHAHNIVHRDIKPGNILLHEGHALVTDFGVARAISVAGQAPITEVGVAVGTPAYMSPEQVTADTAIDGRTDVYSLGCVLFELLTGEPPFHGRDARETLMHHVTKPVPSLQHRRADLPSEISHIVETALAKDPADRFQTARELAEALQSSGDRHTSWSSGLPALPIAGRRRAQRIAMALAAIAALTAALMLFWPEHTPTAARATLLSWQDSIAVLPPENNTANPLHGRDAIRIAELVQNEIARIAGMKVIDLPSVEVYLDSGWTAQRLARALEVRYVLRGMIDTGNDGDMIRTQLVDGHSGALVWGGEFRLDGFAAQAIVRGVLEVLGYPALSDLSVDTSDAGRWELHLGRHALARRTAAGVREAIDHFTTALALDSTYAETYARLAQALALSLTYRYEIGLGEYEVAASALARAERALALDPDLAAGYAARGYLGVIAGAPIDRVAQDFAVAGRLKPNGADIASWRARVLERQGLHDEALTWRERAVQLDPHSAGRHIGVALAALAIGRYGQAIRAAETATSIEPNVVLPRVLKALALLLSGSPAGCLTMDLGPHHVVRATCMLQQGDTAQAEALVQTATARLHAGTTAYPDYTPVVDASDLAGYWAWLGAGPQALQWLRRAFEQSPVAIHHSVLSSALFAKVRDERFLGEVAALERAAWRRVVRQARRPI